jgi:manganese oxidase
MFHHVMNFMSSMVGPMGGHTIPGMRAGQSPTAGMGIATGGSALSDAFGPSLGRSMGEQIGIERAVGNMTVMPSTFDMPAMPGMYMSPESPAHGMMHGGHGSMGRTAAGRTVPGYPQAMMDMPVEMSGETLRKLTGKRETRGMRRDWYTGVAGLMTVVRVLPPELYDRVMLGNDDVAPGLSVPGGPPGEAMPHHHHG